MEQQQEQNEVQTEKPEETKVEYEVEKEEPKKVEPEVKKEVVQEDLSEKIDLIPRLNRDTYIARGIITSFNKVDNLPKLEISQLEIAFQDVLRRAEIFATHTIETEALSVRERMTMILDMINNSGTLKFIDCFTFEEGKMGAIVTFLAILEMVKESLVDIIQNDDFSMIYLQAKL